MTSAVFPKVTTFVKRDAFGNYALQLNPDGTFTTEIRVKEIDVHSCYTWDYRRDDSGTYSIGSNGYTITFQFLGCQVRDCGCQSECDCAPGMRSWTPPDTTVDCDLVDGMLKNFPGVSGYDSSLWKYGEDIPLVILPKPFG